jgi:hypothetical protein
MYTTFMKHYTDLDDVKQNWLTWLINTDEQNCKKYLSQPVIYHSANDALLSAF